MTQIAGVLLVVPPGDPGELLADEPVGPCGSGGGRMPVAAWGAYADRDMYGDALGDAVVADHETEPVCAWLPADQCWWARDLARYPDLPRALVLAWDGMILRVAVDRCGLGQHLDYGLPALYSAAAARVASGTLRGQAVRVIAVDAEGQEVAP